MKQTKPFQVTLSERDKLDLETLAMSDGIQRGMFFDTSGKLRKEKVSSTATHSWIYKTATGLPFKWRDNSGVVELTLPQGLRVK